MQHSKINTVVPLFALIFSVIIYIGFVASTYAYDYTLQLQVLDPNAPADVCPNIPGVQTSIPSGMQLDSNGNCGLIVDRCYSPPRDISSGFVADLYTVLNKDKEISSSFQIRGAF